MTMKVPWNELRQGEQRREALDVVRTAFRTLGDRLERHVTVGYRRDTKIALVIMKNEIQKIVAEIDKEFAQRAQTAVSRPPTGPVDVLPGACGDMSCTQAHGVSGQHTGELGGSK